MEKKMDSTHHGYWKDHPLMVMLIVVLIIIFGIALGVFLRKWSETPLQKIWDTATKQQKDTSGEYILQEEISELEKVCPNGVCEIKTATNEEKCDAIAGKRDDRTEKCIDATKQEMIREPSPLEKDCESKGGRYEITETGSRKCAVITSDAGEVCTWPEDCRSGLCQVSAGEDKQWFCNIDDPFKGCGQFIAPNGKIVAVCR